MNTQQIKDNKVYKQILADSFGGVMYSREASEYVTSELLLLMESIHPDSFDGIMKGVYHFIQNKEV